MIWKLQDAKNKFSELVEAAKTRGPQHVSRRGKPAVVVVDAEEFERLEHQARGPKATFVEFLLDGPKSDALHRAIMEDRDRPWSVGHDLFEP